MRKRSALILAGTLVAQPLVLLARNVVFPPNPVGMRLYQANHSTELIALSVLVCAFLLGSVLHLLRRKRKASPEDSGSYEI